MTVFWTMVPTEATSKMVEAAIKAFQREADHMADEGWQEIWRAMLDAVPTAQEMIEK